MSLSPRDISSLTLQISRSGWLCDFTDAFAAATGLPVRFIPSEGIQNEPDLKGHTYENPFCAQAAENPSACGKCLSFLKELKDRCDNNAVSKICPFGLVESAIPVMFEGHVLGFLRTGQAWLQPSCETRLNQVASELQDDTRCKIEQPSSDTSPMVSEERYRAFIALLELVARNLPALVRNERDQGSLGKNGIDLSLDYIERNSRHPMTQELIVRQVGMSVSSFCAQFKKRTGQTFTRYLSRIRVEDAKKLLGNPNLRISEIAFMAGFHSLTHFNRVLRNLTGTNPTEFRSLCNRDGALRADNHVQSR